jgi:hypothetical protein
MNKYPVNQFEKWLLENHDKTIESLTWQEYNRYHVMYSNQTFYERMIKPNLDRSIVWVYSME